MKKFFEKVKRKIGQYTIMALNRVYILFNPIVENRVLFLSDGRKELGGNLKYVYDYLEGKQYERIVILKANKNEKRSLKQKLNLVYYITTSKYILLEDLVDATSHIKVRKEQDQ